MMDVAGALLSTFIENAVKNGIESVLVFSDIALYQGTANHERIGNCSVDVIYVPADAMAGASEYDPRTIRHKAALEGLAAELEKLEATAGMITFEHPPLVPGQYILYRNGERYELGRVKRVTDDGAFVWYSAGETASKTPWDCIITLENTRNIISTDLGGADARAMFPDRPGKGGVA